ncbi:hypothetical protein [Hymenobacter nivis]|uniref:Uncharacterized protein n=1 Tax=Hymenobacter nivis TaxID=1850093 RepID=A0A502HD83_9BACT|nr:hypothetical protein [Hymenobacter nivis]TPG71994.1 hypothetical protein EAH73_01750 [Hymenobacter nivis]
MAKELTAEEQIAALSKQVADLNTKSDQKDRTIQEQKGKLETQGKDLAQVSKERDQANSTVSEKVDTIRRLEEEAEANEQVIAGHEARLRAAEAAGDGSIVVSHQDKLYRVLVPKFQFEGQHVKAESLASDASLVAKLVEAGSGVLELVEGK